MCMMNHQFVRLRHLGGLFIVLNLQCDLGSLTIPLSGSPLILPLHGETDHTIRPLRLQVDRNVVDSQWSILMRFHLVQVSIE